LFLLSEQRRGEGVGKGQGTEGSNEDCSVLLKLIAVFVIGLKKRKGRREVKALGNFVTPEA